VEEELQRMPQWDRPTLCSQGKTYAANPASALRNQHPFGGPFKVTEWAKGGCQ
jgi:hypothetical protein